MHCLNETIQRYLNGLATPAEIHELTVLAAKHAVHFEEFILQHAEATFAEDFENIDTTQNEFSPQDFYDQRLSAALHKQRRKRKGAKVIAIKRGGRWLNVAATVIAVVLTVSLLFYKQHRLALDHPVSESQDVTTLTTFKGKQFIVLPDSSTVILNEGSELSYDESYGAELRAVTLTGEGFFDVKPDAEHRFTVRSGKITTSVLGTTFNVKAIPGGNSIAITVTKGKVSVATDRKSLGTITKDEQIAVNTINDDYVRTKVNATSETDWTNNFLIINNQRIEEAVAKIAARYNVKITLKNEALKNCRITSAFVDKHSLEDVLVVITTFLNASYILQNKIVTISGGAC